MVESREEQSFAHKLTRGRGKGGELPLAASAVTGGAGGGVPMLSRQEDSWQSSERGPAGRRLLVSG